MSKNLQEIINGKASKKARKRVAQLAEAVAIARADYGNEVEVIPVCTAEGSIPFSQLTADDKLVLAEREVASIRMDTNELVLVLEGYGVSDKLTQQVVEEIQAAAIATNHILTNLTVESKAKYI